MAVAGEIARPQKIRFIPPRRNYSPRTRTSKVVANRYRPFKKSHGPARPWLRLSACHDNKMCLPSKADKWTLLTSKSAAVAIIDSTQNFRHFCWQ
eukprot:scaffold303558_cov34-Prasinocladus_malaysianus.AAC.1